MNQLAHIFLTYVLLSFFIPEASKYLLPIALFAIVLDVDHFPGYIKILSMSKRKRFKLKTKDYVDIFRTPIQEPIGIITVEVIFIFLYLFGIWNIYLFIAATAIFIHWLIDFLTVHTRPFDPYNKKIVCLFFNTKKQRLVSEIIITIISFILFLFVYL